jgi:hypothetical protein
MARQPKALHNTHHTLLVDVIFERTHSPWATSEFRFVFKPRNEANVWLCVMQELERGSMCSSTHRLCIRLPTQLSINLQSCPPSRPLFLVPSPYTNSAVFASLPSSPSLILLSAVTAQLILFGTRCTPLPHRCNHQPTRSLAWKAPVGRRSDLWAPSACAFCVVYIA